jgi:hypothetical protein
VFPQKINFIAKEKQATSLLVSSNKHTTQEVSFVSSMLQLFFNKKLKAENDAKLFPGNMEKTTSKFCYQRTSNEVVHN